MVDLRPVKATTISIFWYTRPQPLPPASIMSAFTRSRFPYFILICVLILICLPTEGVYAFGAGNIPSYSHMEGKEDTLAELAAGAGKGLLGISALGGAKKFTGLQIKRIYFGNWLRDYSQAMDIAAVAEAEHNQSGYGLGLLGPRILLRRTRTNSNHAQGYGDGEDPRQYHPKLRAAIDPRELEVDYRTGEQSGINYIGNGMWPSNTHDPGYLNQKTEDGPWDTSKGHIRRVLEQCIEMGRRARSSGRKEEEYESLRLLGTAVIARSSLHTLEDFPAHSNFCELALVSLGYNEVFVHMGDQVRIQAPNGRMVAPLVTGTFGGSDFIHSLLGEATDHISEASVSDLTKEFDKARSRSANQSQASAALRELIFQLPGGGDNDLRRDMEGVERLRASTQPGVAGGTKPPEEMSPQELHAVLWQVLKFRDSVAKKIEKTIEKIPVPATGCLFADIQTPEPFMKPILQSATTALQSGSAEVINSHDQYEVFNDPHAGLILNEPAVNAWDDHSIHPRQAIDRFHPDFHDPNSAVQREMIQYMGTIKSQSNPHDVARRLSRESVRNHQATRLKEQGADAHASGAGKHAQYVRHAQQDLANYFNNMGAGSIGNIFSGHGSRELSGDNIPPSGPPAHGPPPIHVNTSAIPATGEAGQYYGTTIILLAVAWVASDSHLPHSTLRIHPLRVRGIIQRMETHHPRRSLVDRLLSRRRQVSRHQVGDIRRILGSLNQADSLGPRMAGLMARLPALHLSLEDHQVEFTGNHHSSQTLVHTPAKGMVTTRVVITQITGEAEDGRGVFLTPRWQVLHLPDF
ncbi:heterokaryon incompatibility protein HET-C [Rhizoctonia solani AG-1 IA]|uniref:Heterokaryon incompatibility protein HET-C n=1 Tax=Thanatephorus cucumeris (strain AG1-IA) TaxID=983506 RepID=L8WYH9_THACA|nr:heterokaryon incompatibility protein HET-C [Rhizoctonia solani AG-1 IA]